MDSRNGFIRVAAISPDVVIGNPWENFHTIKQVLEKSPIADCDVVVFPENFITGYTCGDLFAQKKLLEETKKVLLELRGFVKEQLVIVGAPVLVGNALYNCAVGINDGKIVGVLPKRNLPNYKEFYESRWFRAGSVSDPKDVFFSEYEPNVPFGIDHMYQVGDLLIGGEVCEDVFMASPPSSDLAVAGASILYNCSASPEQVAKSEYRRDLVKNQSGRCIAAYIYSSSGPSESTSDLVFGAHCLIAENASLLAESRRVGDGLPLIRDTTHCIADVDYQKLLHDRRSTTSFFNTDAARNYRHIPIKLSEKQHAVLERKITATPFVPQKSESLHIRCAEVFDIQSAGLVRRLEQLKPTTKASIGISGGLDSTLAALTLVRACRALPSPLTRIKALTMPGFGTTKRTKSNAHDLCLALGIELEEVDIRPACFQTFLDLNYKPFGIDLRNIDVPEGTANPMAYAIEQFEKMLLEVPKENRNDLNFENVQARHRTLLLMSSGVVIGTGDMSEMALGWCTYNADHMSMYNPNCSIPKTLVKFLVKYVAENLAVMGPNTAPALKDVLLDIVNTPISPELLPRSNDGQIEQSTEDMVGPYELHDFFLFHFIRNGFPPEKIVYLAQNANGFSKNYTVEEIKKWLVVFYKRFFWAQFKRNCVPDGPKVGSVSLSPRGDWRMPSEADPTIWLESIGK